MSETDCLENSIAWNKGLSFCVKKLPKNQCIAQDIVEMSSDGIFKEQLPIKDKIKYLTWITLVSTIIYVLTELFN